MELMELWGAIKESWGDVNKLTVWVAALACFVAWRTWRTQSVHNRLSVVPLPSFGFRAGKKGLHVKLINNGIGPMRILSLRFVRFDGVVFDSFAQVVSTRAAHFKTNLDGKALGANREFLLLDMAGEATEVGVDLETTRLELSVHTVVLEYTDVYGTKFKKHTESLEWFEKHG